MGEGKGEGEGEGEVMEGRGRLEVDQRGRYGGSLSSSLNGSSTPFLVLLPLLIPYNPPPPRFLPPHRTAMVRVVQCPTARR